MKLPQWFKGDTCPGDMPIPVSFHWKSVTCGGDCDLMQKPRACCDVSICGTNVTGICHSPTGWGNYPPKPKVGMGGCATIDNATSLLPPTCNYSGYSSCSAHPGWADDFWCMLSPSGDQCRPESFKPCIWNNTCQTNCIGAAMHKLPCKEICRPGISPCPIDQMQCYVERTTRKTCFQATHSGHLTPLQCEGSAEDIVEVQCEPTEHYVIYGQTCPQNAEPIMTSWKSKKFDRGLGCRACHTVPGFFAPDKVPGGGSSPSCYFHDDEPVTPLFYSSTCYQAPIRGEADSSYIDRVLCPSET